MLDPLLPEEFRKKAAGIQKNAGFKKSAQRKNTAGETQKFQNLLETRTEEVFSAETDEFLESLETLERDLLEKPGADTIARYRKGVGDFLRKVTSNYAHMDFYRTRNGQKTSFRIWQILDRELDQAYRETLSGQVRAFMMLDRLQEIKGLIIDLKVGKEERK